jgi:ATP-binding cassette, subfamily B, bacterial
MGTKFKMRGDESLPSAASESETQQPHLAFNIARQMRSQWPWLALILFLEMLSTPLALLAPVGIKIAIDNVIGSKSVPEFLTILFPASRLRNPGDLLLISIAIQLGVAVLIQVHWYCNYLLKIRNGERMVLNFRSRLFEHAQQLPLSFHDSRGSGDTAFRLQDDAAALKSITLDGVLFLASDILKLLAMALVTLWIDWRLGMVALSVAPILCLHAFVYQRHVGGKYKEVRKLESSAFRVIHEALCTIRVVKAFVQEQAEQRRFFSRSSAASGARVKLAHADGIFGMAVNLTTAAGMAMVLFVGIRNVQAGSLTLGSLLMVITYLVQLYSPLQNITYHLASLKASAAGVERAMDVFRHARESADTSVLSVPVPRRAFGTIEFQNVTFAYGSKAPILHNFSFEIPAGSRIGLVGKTGVGKTTIINLLARFISPQSGRILLDGRDIQALDLAELRKQFAFVLQEPMLFSTSLADNIAYGRPGARREEIIQAAKAAKAHDFIQCLPDGYESQAGERGFSLSGGERQRISIARAFLIDAPILVFDEPTSSIDVATEAEVLNAMERLSAGRTCFFISHRLNTFAACDYLLKLTHGAPVEVSVCRSRNEFQSLLNQHSQDKEHSQVA